MYIFHYSEKKLVFILLLFFILTTAGITQEKNSSDSSSSSTKNWSLSIEPLVGIRYGYIGEHLYYYSDGEYKRLSYLEWDMKPLFLYGGNISARYKKIGFSAYVKSAAPIRCGSMQDSDWMDLDDTKNDYSISENTLNALIEAGCTAHYNFHPYTWIAFGPEFSFDYNYISFSAENGYGWYGDSSNSNGNGNVSYDSDDATYYPSGYLCGISYNRTSFYTWLGITSTFTPFEKWSFGFSSAVAVYSFEYAYDHHDASSPSQEGYYLDEVEAFFSRCKATISAQLDITKQVAVKLSILGFIGWPVQGTTYEAPYDDTSNSNPVYYVLSGYEGGTSIYYAECDLGCKIKLL